MMMYMQPPVVLQPQQTPMPQQTQTQAQQAQQAHPQQQAQQAQQQAQPRRKLLVNYEPAGPQPQYIGNYKVGRTLGTGSFGKVKLGTNIWTGEHVAIKSIPLAKRDHRIDKEIENLKTLTGRTTPRNNTGNTNGTVNGKKKKSSSQQQSTLKKTHHPNIIRLHETVEENNKLHIVMEYVSGGELFEYIVQKRRLREEEARKLFREMVSALEFLHGNLIVHRDLKLENILLTEDGHVKIADFGFSSMMKPAALFGTFCGSPMYSAPELFMGQEYLGPPVDIWSLGVILYAMVCGFLPFGKWKDDMKTLVKKVCDGEFEIPNLVSRPCQKLIVSMLRPNIEERITLDQIRKDPWVNFDYNHLPLSYLFVPNSPLIDSGKSKKSKSKYPDFDLSEIYDSDENIPNIPNLFGGGNGKSVSKSLHYVKMLESNLNMDIVNQMTSLGLGFGTDPKTVKERLLACLTKGERSQIVAIYFLLLEKQEKQFVDLEKQQIALFENQNSLEVIFEEMEENFPTRPLTSSSSAPSSSNSPQVSPSSSPPRSRADSWNSNKKSSVGTQPSSPSLALRFLSSKRSSNDPPKPQPLLSPTGSPSPSSSPPNSSLTVSHSSKKITSITPRKLYASCGNEMTPTSPSRKAGSYMAPSTLSSPLTLSPSPPPSPPPSSTSSSSSSRKGKVSSFIGQVSASFSGTGKVMTDSEIAYAKAGANGNFSAFGVKSCKANMFNVDTSSSKSPEEIADLLKTALEKHSHELKYKVKSNGFEFKCKTIRTSTSVATSPKSTPSTSPTSSQIWPEGGGDPGGSRSSIVFRGLLGGAGIMSGTGSTGIGSFAIQVCKINKLNLYGVRCSQFSGDRWRMRDLCGEILKELNL